MAFMGRQKIMEYHESRWVEKIPTGLCMCLFCTLVNV